MADDVTVSPTATYDVAADDVGGGKLAQLFKLAYSADGSRVLVTADVNGLLVQIASLPLPALAATSTIQATQQTSLTSIDGKTPALGQQLAAASSPVVLTAAQLATLTPLASVAATGPLTDAQLRAVAVSVEESGLALAAILSTDISTATINGKTPALGQQLAAASSPVVLTAAQITTLTPPAAITGFGTEATQLLQATAANQTTELASLAAINAKIPTTITDSLGTVRMPVDLEASDYDIGGTHVINVIDRQQRRMHEQDQLAAYVQAMQAMLNIEWESSHRMGFEVR